jgi:hypothetical protein
MVPIIQYLPEPISDDLAQRIQCLTTLERIFQWVQDARLHLGDLIQQDEYTTDVIIILKESLVLSFDVSCVGNVRNVSVWGHTPTAQEILQARLARGWQPTSSEFINGSRVIGYAGENRQ